ncbi:hypothetical protein [Cloacibacillus porcorum]|uniref:Uncharacterized protein n=1 Tax=Cloacibacillus porcorum TaxID=1197717 RepID=A0A1B2I689_9BACT|nr:hypothetical protein [Cloacibacillus porcorum]ANZ45485.1 hypothetical protein BED41_10640 [Cloacibacillus porcorum]
MAEQARKKIEARVARVISSEMIVINKGEDDGIILGMPFLVYRLGENIIDPETNKDLGQLEIIVGRGRAAHIQKNMTTLYADDKAGSFLAGLSSLLPQAPSIDGAFNSPSVGDYVKSLSK